MEEGNKQLHLMGTIIDLKIKHSYPQPLLNEIEKDLIVDEKRFSANDETSELSQVNKYAGKKPVIVHEDLFYLIKKGKEESLRNNTNLNIAVGPLVQTWRIGFKDAKVPTKEEIISKLPLIDPHNIILNEEKSSVYLKKAGMKIDLGALAKGYFTDEVVHKLKKAGSPEGLVNLGGNIMVYGASSKHSDGNWRIGIQDPFKPRGNYLHILKIRDKSIVTSGIYERNLTKNGKQYHHILDTSTGYPLETTMVSVTIVSDDSLAGEIWTTHLFGKSPQEAIELINKVPEIDGLVIDCEKNPYYSQGFLEKYLK